MEGRTFRFPVFFSPHIFPAVFARPRSLCFTLLFPSSPSCPYFASICAAPEANPISAQYNGANIEVKRWRFFVCCYALRLEPRPACEVQGRTLNRDLSFSPASSLFLPHYPSILATPAPLPVVPPASLPPPYIDVFTFLQHLALSVDSSATLLQHFALVPRFVAPPGATSPGLPCFPLVPAILPLPRSTGAYGNCDPAFYTPHQIGIGEGNLLRFRSLRQQLKSVHAVPSQVEVVDRTQGTRLIPL